MIIIFNADNIIFGKAVAAGDFYRDEFLFAGIGDTVGSPQGRSMMFILISITKILLKFFIIVH